MTHLAHLLCAALGALDSADAHDLLAAVKSIRADADRLDDFVCHGAMDMIQNELAARVAMREGKHDPLLADVAGTIHAFFNA